MSFAQIDDVSIGRKESTCDNEYVYLSETSGSTVKVNKQAYFASMNANPVKFVMQLIPVVFTFEEIMGATWKGCGKNSRGLNAEKREAIIGE